MGLAQLALVVLVAAGLGQEHAVSGRGVATGGTCVEYPAEGEYCSEYGLGGLNVFHFDGVGTVSERSDQAGAAFAAVVRAAQATATSDCVFQYIRMLCASWFPPCDANENPRLPCMSLCEAIDSDICKKAYDAARGLGVLQFMVFCTTDVAGGGNTVGNNLMPDFLPGWEGNLVFQEETYTDNALPGSPSVQCMAEGGDASAACKPQACPEPYLETRYPKLVNESLGGDFLVPEDYDYCLDKSNDMDCERCVSECSAPCKYDFLFTDGEFAVLATVQWLPGLLALPLNLLVFVSERSKLQKMKKTQRSVAERLVFFSAIFGILLFFIDGLPAMILGQDIRCDGHPGYSIYTNVDGSSWCWFAKIKVHLLQALMFTVVCTLYRLRMQLKASLSMARYTPSKLARFSFVFSIFILPLLLALGTFLGESDQLYETNFVYRDAQNAMNEVGEDETRFEFLTMANNLRYSYSCGPKMRTVTDEIFVYQGPLILAGVMCMCLSVSLVRIVAKMGGKSSSAGDKSGKKKQNKALRSLAVNTVRFAVINVALVLLNTISTALYLPQAIQFSLDFGQWNSCATSGIDYRGDEPGGRTNPDAVTNGTATFAANEAWCGSISEIAPSLPILLLLQVAQTLPPLAFGVVFALPALKQLKASIASKVRPSSTGKSGAASTALSNKSET